MCELHGVDPHRLFVMETTSFVILYSLVGMIIMLHIGSTWEKMLYIFHVGIIWRNTMQSLGHWNFSPVFLLLSYELHFLFLFFFCRNVLQRKPDFKKPKQRMLLLGRRSKNLQLKEALRAEVRPHFSGLLVRCGSLSIPISLAVSLSLCSYVLGNILVGLSL